jgi:hypothetical protein
MVIDHGYGLLARLAQCKMAIMPTCNCRFSRTGTGWTFGPALAKAGMLASRPLSAPFLQPVLTRNPLLEDNIDARQAHPRSEPSLADLLGRLSTAGLAHGETAQVQTLSLDGARALLHAAEQKAQQLSAPSSLAVVDVTGDLILFEQMEGARPVGIDLAVGKARSPPASGKLPIRSRRRSTPAGRQQSPPARSKWTAACRSVSAAQWSGRSA